MESVCGLPRLYEERDEIGEKATGHVYIAVTLNGWAEDTGGVAPAMLTSWEGGTPCCLGNRAPALS